MIAKEWKIFSHERLAIFFGLILDFLLETKYISFDLKMSGLQIFSNFHSLLIKP